MLKYAVTNYVPLQLLLYWHIGLLEPPGEGAAKTAEADTVSMTHLRQIYAFVTIHQT